MENDNDTEIHIKQALSSSKIMELMDNYPNLETITCSPSVYKRIPKKYVEALDTLDIAVKIDYKWGRSPKASNTFLKNKIMKLAETGKTAKEIAKNLDISLNKVYYLVKQNDENFKFNDYKRKYTDEEKDLMISMKNNGKSVKEISKKLNIPTRSVYYILNNK